VADYIGGVKSRRLAVLAVVLASQAAGLVIAAIVVAIRGEGPPGGDFAIYAALSGVAGATGLAAFYRGLAIGAMSVVAPISATAAVLPVAVGIATGDRPSALQGLGVSLAIVGVVLASRESSEAAGPGNGASARAKEPADASARVAAGVGLALIAAIGFGCFFVAMDAASDDDVFWAILVNRITSTTLLVTTALATRPQLPREGRDLAAVVAIGLLDISANTMFAIASTEGLLSLVGVLGSLYPVTTIALARYLLGERIQRLQQVGVVAALCGVALIAAG
jgi:drug/metabolite transporter (DMT)-like permease